MKGIILLNYNENVRQVEEEEKARFLKSFLEQCFESNSNVSAQICDIWENENIILSAPQKVKLRGILTTYGIQVVDDLDGHMKIYLDNELVAEWFKCSYKLKRDFQVVDPRHRVFIEMNVECWSAFDPTTSQEEI